MADPLPDHDIGMPRWVKVSGAIAALVVVLAVILMWSGHGPGRHIPPAGSSIDAGTATQSSGVGQ